MEPLDDLTTSGRSTVTRLAVSGAEVDRPMGPTTYRRMLLRRLGASAERCRQTGALSGLGRLLGTSPSP